MKHVKLSTVTFACAAVLFTGLVSAARPWGPFAPTTSYGDQHPCVDPTSFLFTSTPVIWGDVLVVHGKRFSSTERLKSQYEGVYTHNTSSLDVPVDLGVITTNDNFTGLYIPFEYREFYQVRINQEKLVVIYEGVGMNTLAACRVRAST